jgi:hypothetical protein
VLPRSVRHWTLTTLRKKLIKIGAKVVRHSRKIVFQMSEVAAPRELFRAVPPLFIGWCSRRESNADTRIRNPLLYPFELREHSTLPKYRYADSFASLSAKGWRSSSWFPS